VEDHLIPRRPTERLLTVELRAPLELLTTIEQRLAQLGFSADMVSVERKGDAMTAAFNTRGHGNRWAEAVRALLAMEGVEKVELA
jgi:hypothetical protein